MHVTVTAFWQWSFSGDTQYLIVDGTLFKMVVLKVPKDLIPPSLISVLFSV